jgi:hypothetical protein
MGWHPNVCSVVKAVIHMKVINWQINGAEFIFYYSRFVAEVTAQLNEIDNKYKVRLFV